VNVVQESVPELLKNSAHAGQLTSLVLLIPTAAQEYAVKEYVSVLNLEINA